MNEASLYLYAWAERVAHAYTAHPQAAAAMVTGSVAEDASDHFSDIDMMLYYETLPSDEEVEAARRTAFGVETRLWKIGDENGGSFAEAFVLPGGIECQVSHATVAAWERDMDTVLINHVADTPLQKALEGTLKCLPLYGQGYIARWKERAENYPEGLRVAMVTHYLRFFPWWGLQDRLGVRDAALWRTQSLLEGAQNLLGVLSGINRRYYTTFQFKRMRSFVEKLDFAPPCLADRLESLFTSAPDVAVLEFERLVGETVALVETQLPEVTTAGVRGRLGWRQKPWTPVGEDSGAA